MVDDFKTTMSKTFAITILILAQIIIFVAPFHHVMRVGMIRNRMIGRQTFTSLHAVDSDPTKESTDTDEEANLIEELVEDKSQEVDTPAVEEEDPTAKLIAEMESKLTLELELLQDSLVVERKNIARTKDKISESGKNGFFIVQAQVNNFQVEHLLNKIAYHHFHLAPSQLQRDKEVQQKQRVAKNKKEFVTKMLPVVDGFREAPIVAPASTERGHSIHKNFGALLTGILTVFEKYGFKEYSVGEYVCMLSSVWKAWGWAGHRG